MGERGKALVCSVFQFQCSKPRNGGFQAMDVTLPNAQLGKHVQPCPGCRASVTAHVEELQLTSGAQILIQYNNMIRKG